MTHTVLTTCAAVQHIHAALADDAFLEAFYRHYASIDSPKRSPWRHERHVPGAEFHKSCRLLYVAKSVAALWYMHNTTGGPLSCSNSLRLLELLSSVC